VLGWIVVSALFVIAFLRIVAWDRLQPLVVVNAASLVVYLPAWLVLAGALVWRRWWLAATAAAVAAAQLAFVLPELTAATAIPAAARTAPAITLFDANVYDGNPSMEGYARQIRAAHPDVVTLEEASPLDEVELEAAGALRDLPFRLAVRVPGPQAFLIASRYRLVGRQVATLDGFPYLVRTTLELPGGPLPLWVVHTTAPVNPGWRRWSRELDGVAALLARRHPRPVLMVGDFNATWGNRGFREVLDQGMTDAAAARGQALDMTWPQGRAVPPFVRIDHVLTAGALVVTEIATATGPGSDHRELTARVALLAQRK
jgi:endonuclease/exonuclease/phosphatase (EEP) superfamily protein YafD